MKRYIEQLIGDIREATLNVRMPSKIWLDSKANPDDELELEDMSYIEQFVEGGEEPVSKITGIDKTLLPPPEKLTDDQKSVLSVELEKLLEVFHFQLEFPENYPAHLRYSFILDFWDGEQVAVSFGTIHVEFCDYNEELCPFSGYCLTCKEFAEQQKLDEKIEQGIDWELSIDDILPGKNEIEKWAKANGIALEEEPDLDDIFGKSDDEDYDPALDFVGGFFNDDGTRIDPESIPVPGLCIICKKHQYTDPEENFLCMMNRNDQRNDPDFKCGAFEKI
jgi:hypothetical protein